MHWLVHTLHHIHLSRLSVTIVRMSAFVESKLDKDLVTKAVHALLKYEVKKAKEGSKKMLVANYAKPILVQVRSQPCSHNVLNRIRFIISIAMQVQLFKDVAKPVTKPTRVKIPHSLFSADEEDNTICLFCRSDDKEAITQYLEKNPISGLTKVISINDAKKHYKQFKDKKTLLTEHTHFVCDSRIAGQLYNILGSTFSVRSDYPVQINFTNPAQLPGLVQKVIDSTYFHLAGKNVSIRLGHTAMKPEEVVANLLEGLPFAVEKLQNGWQDVHSMHLKTNDSAALPIYSHSANEMMQYVSTQAAAIPAPASSAAATPGKGKKTTATANISAATPAATEKEGKTSATPATTKSAEDKTETSASGKKRKAEVAAEETPATSVPASAKKTAPASVTKAPAAAKAETAAPKSAAKKAKVSAAAQEEEQEEAQPATTPAPKSAMKGAKTAKSAASTPAPAKQAEDEDQEEAAAAKSAVRGKKSAAKEAEAVEPTPRKSARRGAATKDEDVPATAATPSARGAPKRATSARK
jgi:ribosome biogenesis protein UTP30